MIRKNGRPGQIQITGVLRQARWKLALRIEGGAQGNRYTPFTSIYCILLTKHLSSLCESLPFLGFL